MAGGGKSASVLMKNLDGIHDKNFRCSILRRYEPELKKLGGLIDESKNVYSFFTKEPYKTQNKQWIFPSGAMIAFGAISCDDDLRSWQGSQLTRICVDEVCTGWTEKQILFLQSRLRTVGSDIHPQLLLTGNPEFSSFMKEWVDFCLDPIQVYLFPEQRTEFVGFTLRIIRQNGLTVQKNATSCMVNPKG
jgi:hypothetical protein